MLNSFRKFVGFKILEYFLAHYGGIVIDIDETEFVYEFAQRFLETTKKIIKEKT